jgi:hypothetical protein
LAFNNDSMLWETLSLDKKHNNFLTLLTTDCNMIWAKLLNLRKLLIISLHSKELDKNLGGKAICKFIKREKIILFYPFNCSFNHSGSLDYY